MSQSLGYWFIAYLEQLWPILSLTLQVCGVAVLISAVIGLPIGVWMGLNSFRGKRFVLGITQTGMALPPVVVGLVLYLLLSRSGPLGSLGWLFSPQAMIIPQVILDLPFIVGITVVAVGAAASCSGNFDRWVQARTSAGKSCASPEPASSLPSLQQLGEAFPKSGRCGSSEGISKATRAC